MTTFAARLAQALEHDGRPRNAIAAEIGVHPSRLSEWTSETHPIVPTLEYVQALSRAMPWLSVEWLVTGRGSEYFSGDAP